MYFTFLFLLIGWILLGTFLGYRFSQLAGSRSFFKKHTFLLIGIGFAVAAGTFGVLVNGMYSYQIIMKNNLYAFSTSLLFLLAMTKVKKKRKVKARKPFILRWKKLRLLSRFLYTTEYGRTRT